MNLGSLKPFFEPHLLSEIDRFGIVKQVKKGDILIDIGEQIQFIPLIIEGAVKVLREDASGDEILLYFVDFGNTCAMTLNCCMENTPSEIRAVCEADTSLIMIPATYMDNWLAKYKSWRIFIFDNFQGRLNELLKAVDSLTFLKLDERLERYINEKAELQKNKKLNITHLEIATDLNSSRVVISRLLKKMEKDGLLLLGRNTIQILN
ncbi:Crp/Fnr family transcriptional regulator [Flavobacteriaceae bacterium]|nr:Crp/Fnr family transcriptional regulator [Flavobacteriaceae bacterium]MDC0103763.1 Crp/Fnr family transcriptional regulator [Flavobacteriaceae bacterium]